MRALIARVNRSRSYLNGSTALVLLIFGTCSHSRVPLCSSLSLRSSSSRSRAAVFFSIYIRERYISFCNGAQLIGHALFPAVSINAKRERYSGPNRWNRCLTLCKRVVATFVSLLLRVERQRSGAINFSERVFSPGIFAAARRVALGIINVIDAVLPRPRNYMRR